MNAIERTIAARIVKCLFKSKAVVIYGARQVGKTTLLKRLAEQHRGKMLFLNCDEPDIRADLTGATSTKLKAIVGGSTLVLIDEAQRVKNIGLTLKLMVDNLPDTQVVATGSSSFEMSQEVVEPLTGRCYEFHLYPFSLEELAQMYDGRDRARLLERFMVFGMYPEVVLKTSEAATLLSSLAGSYLYQDILRYEGIRRPELLERLLTALALQAGREVSYNELASLLGVNKQTVANYVDILEKAFVVFRLPPYSRNPRKELSKLRKIYFYDIGIRNALINNMNPLNLRDDVGALWENFILCERMKVNHNHGRMPGMYFWRTLQQQEIDCLEVAGGTMRGFEFKWRNHKHAVPKAFTDAYPDSSVEVVSNSSYAKFIGLEP